MQYSETTAAQAVEAALALYDTVLKPMEATHKGQFVAIDPESGDYAIAPTTIDASRTLRIRHPNGFFVTRSIGPETRQGIVSHLFLGSNNEEKATK